MGSEFERGRTRKPAGENKWAGARARCAKEGRGHKGQLRGASDVPVPMEWLVEFKSLHCVFTHWVIVGSGLLLLIISSFTSD